MLEPLRPVSFFLVVGDMLPKMSFVFPRQGALCRQRLPWRAESLPCCSCQTPFGCPWPGLAGDPACGLTSPRPASLLCCPVVAAMLGSRELWSPARPWHWPAWHSMPPWPSPSATLAPHHSWRPSLGGWAGGHRHGACSGLSTL